MASPVRSAPILRAALAYAGALGLPIVDHAEDAPLTAGAEANDGYVATVLGLRGWPAAAEEAAVARDLAVLADVVRDVPGARLHLTHLSTAGALELVRRAKAAGLPRHLRRHAAPPRADRRMGRRRAALGLGRRSGDPWADGALVAGAVRAVAPRQPAAAVARGCRGLPGGARRRHGRRGRHRPRPPHRGGQGGRVRRWRPTGSAASRRRSGVLLAAVDAGRLPLAAGDRGADDGSCERARAAGSRRAGSVGLVEGAPADLVVFDRSEAWTVTAGAPRLARQEHAAARDASCAGRVLVTLAGGRLAYEAPDA